MEYKSQPTEFMRTWKVLNNTRTVQRGEGEIEGLTTKAYDNFTNFSNFMYKSTFFIARLGGEGVWDGGELKEYSRFWYFNPYLYESDCINHRYKSKLQIPCVQEVVTPFYIITYYIKWGNYFLDTRYLSQNLTKTSAGIQIAKFVWFKPSLFQYW